MDEGDHILPPFWRTLFLGICFVPLGLGMFLTLADSSFKKAKDWVETHRDMYWTEHGGGPSVSAGNISPLHRTLEE